MKQNHKFKKKYGQNFIKNNKIVEKIVDSSMISKDSTVIEIGPGEGVLTEVLDRHQAFVIAYEIDTDLKGKLENKFGSNDNIKIIWGDFLQTDVKKDISSLDRKLSNISVIANIPYYITSPIILKLIETGIEFNEIILMVQKEFGDRICAKNGTKDYGSFTAYINYFFNTEKLFFVDKREFIPQPNVDSIVIKLTPKKERITAKNEKLLFQLIRDSFQYKRKTLKNNLKGYDYDKVQDVLNNLGYNENVRAEDLSIEDFIKISDSLN